MLFGPVIYYIKRQIQARRDARNARQKAASSYAAVDWEHAHMTDYTIWDGVL